MRVPPVPLGLERAAGWAWRLIACVIGLAAVLVLLWYLRVIVLPVIVALTLAPALTPLNERLRRRGFGRMAPGVSLVVGLAFVAGLFAVVTGSLAADYDDLVVSVRQAVDDLTQRLEREPFNLSLERNRDLDQSLRETWGTASTYLLSGVRSGANVLVGIVLAITLLYFVLRDGGDLWRRVVRRFDPGTSERVGRAGERAWDVLGGYVRGVALIAAIDATLIGIGLAILGVPLAFALAVLIFLGAFVPFIGATLAGLVAVLVAFADGGITKALIALGIVLGVQFLEGTFLQPIIQSRTVDLHPAVILLAVAAGGSLFGILGAYLAVPVTAVLLAITTSLANDVQVDPQAEGLESEAHVPVGHGEA